VLDDGNYDVMILDAAELGEEGSGTVRLELTVVAGPSRGEVVAVRAEGLDHVGDPLGLLGLPARLVVHEGEPRVELD
jgi:hypothetical protein